MAVEYVPSAPWSSTAPVERYIAFLSALSQHGSKRRAMEQAGVSREQVDRLREADPAFSAAFDAAVEEAADRLEQEARRRAVEGVDRPVYQGGVHVGDVREYSDRLLEVMLKARVGGYADKPAQVDARSATLVIGAGPALPQGEGLADWLAGLQKAAGEVAVFAAKPKPPEIPESSSAPAREEE